MGYAQNSLVSAIYDLALGRPSWDTILDSLAASFPSCLVIVSGDDFAARRNLAFSQRGIGAEAAAAYVATYASLNPWLEGEAGLAPHQVFHDDQLLDRAEAHRSRFVAEWLAPLGSYEAATGVVLLREGTRQLTLELRYAAGDGATRERAAQVLGEAAQHFGRALEIASRFRFSAGRGYLDHVVEDLPFSVFFVDRELRVHYSNAAGDALRRLPSGPFGSVDGVLRAADAGCDATLRQAVVRTMNGKRMPASILELRRTEGGDRYFGIARLAQREGQHNQLHDAILDPGPLVMLVIHGSLELAALPMDVLWRAFSLTESEARLAEALLAGATLADVAKQHALSKQTLRNQLVGVMRKTNTRRQSELVSLLTRLALTCL